MDAGGGDNDQGDEAQCALGFGKEGTDAGGVVWGVGIGVIFSQSLRVLLDYG